MKKFRVAVIGAGHLGNFHARNYTALESVSLVGICDTDPERAREIAALYATTAYTDYHQLLDKVDAVSVAVPTIHHYEVARAFLSCGIATLVEKPITPTVAEATRLISIAKKNDALLQVGHIERFNSAVDALHDSCGKTRFIEVHRLGPFKKRSLDISVVLDLMIHDLDIVLWLVQSQPKRVDAIGVKVLSSHADIANARITFKNGAVANITASRLTPTATRKIRIFQDESYISLDYAQQEASLYRKDHDAITHKKIDIRKEEPLKRELISFIDAARSKTHPVVSGQAAKEALRLARLIERKIA